MPTDIKLDEDGGNSLVLDGAVVKTTASDIIVDAPARRIRPTGLRRALVHDPGDGLTINFNSDYPGGVTVGGPLRTGSVVVSGDLKVTGEIEFQSVEGPRKLSQVVRDLQRQTDAARIRRIEVALESMAVLLEASIVPDWPTVQDVEEGDSMGLLFLPAEQLGLNITYTDRTGRPLQGIPPEDPDFLFRVVLGLRPEAGTMLRRGSTVVVRVDFDG